MSCWQARLYRPSFCDIAGKTIRRGEKEGLKIVGCRGTVAAGKHPGLFAGVQNGFGLIFSFSTSFLRPSGACRYFRDA